MKSMRILASALLLALLVALLPLAAAEGTSADGYAALLPGDTGEAVTALQQKLIEKGYLQGEASGVLDDATAQALTRFQTDSGLEATGEATVETQQALFAEAGAEELTVENAPFIGNKNTKKFHKAGCSSVKEMKDKNKVPLASREEAVDAGYVPCKRCNP